MTRIKRDKEHSSLETWLIRYSGRKLLKASCTKLPSVNFNITLRLSINLIYPTMTSFSTIIMQHIFFLCFDTTGNIPAKEFVGGIKPKGEWVFFIPRGKGALINCSTQRSKLTLAQKNLLFIWTSFIVHQLWKNFLFLRENIKTAENSISFLSIKPLDK